MSIITNTRFNVQRKLNYMFADLQSRFGLNNSFFQKARGARIVVYHGICKTDHTRFNSIFLRLKTFEQHLRFYKKYFHIVSLDDYYNKRFDTKRFNICISFDDGFANNYKYVLPLLKKYQLPVTFFITAIRDAGYNILWNDALALLKKYSAAELQFFNEQFIKKNGGYVSKVSGKFLKDLLRETNFDKKTEIIKIFQFEISAANKNKEEDYWLQMTKEEIKTLSQSQLATIGCHGYYHNDLSKITASELNDEITRSKKFLENIIEKKVDAIAFPYGAYSKDVVTACKSVGFTKLLATDFLFTEDNDDDLLRERFTINPYISVNNQMIAIINGKYK